MSDTDIILTKLEKQDKPTMLLTDIDGTLFSPNLNLLTAPLFNLQTAAYISAKCIPFIIVTGRSFWRRIDKYHLKLLGVPKPDAVITANGTIIYFATRNGYISDFSWQGTMQSTKVTDAQGNVSSWNKAEITDGITQYLQSNGLMFRLGRGNTYLIRIRLNTYPLKQVDAIRREVLKLFPKGIRIILTEKLLWKNSLETFSGELLITPSTAGKDKAVQYVLKNLAIELNRHSGSENVITNKAKQSNEIATSPSTPRNDKRIHAFLFGDATVDIPMLTMKEDPTSYTLSQYGVHPTPLAREMLKEKMKDNNSIHILEGDGPKEILWTLRPELRVKHPKGTSFAEAARQASSVKESQRFSTSSNNNTSVIASEGTEAKQSQQFNNLAIKQSQFTPAQNNKARNVIRKFEWALDRLVDKNLSPNEISVLGLNKLSLGLKQLNDKSVITKTKGWYHYTFGNLTDVLDGIRARQRKALSVKRKENPVISNPEQSGMDEKSQNILNTKYVIPDTAGHLIDGFSDRAKEFMQLFQRAKKRVHEDEKIALQTYIAAISCALPSIAREQAEIMGVAVPEKDEMGGSMIDRTKRLFLSLLFDSFGLPDQSLAKDKEILEKNVATFRHRLTFSKKFSSIRINPVSMSDFQKKGLGKFLLYVDVLQQEDKIIKKGIGKYKTLAKEYERESQKLAKQYLTLPIAQLRKKFKIKDYKLEVKKYL